MKPCFFPISSRFRFINILERFFFFHFWYLLTKVINWIPSIEPNKLYCLRNQCSFRAIYDKMHPILSTGETPECQENSVNIDSPVQFSVFLLFFLWFYTAFIASFCMTHALSLISDNNDWVFGLFFWPFVISVTWMMKISSHLKENDLECTL